MNLLALICGCWNTLILLWRVELRCIVWDTFRACCIRCVSGEMKLSARKNWVIFRHTLVKAVLSRFNPYTNELKKLSAHKDDYSYVTVTVSSNFNELKKLSAHKDDYSYVTVTGSSNLLILYFISTSLRLCNLSEKLLLMVHTIQYLSGIGDLKNTHHEEWLCNVSKTINLKMFCICHIY